MRALHIYLATTGVDEDLINSIEELGFPMYVVKQPKGHTLYKSTICCYDYADNSCQTFWGRAEILGFIKRNRSQTYISPFDGQKK